MTIRSPANNGDGPALQLKFCRGVGRVPELTKNWYWLQSTRISSAVANSCEGLKQARGSNVDLRLQKRRRGRFVNKNYYNLSGPLACLAPAKIVKTAMLTTRSRSSLSKARDFRPCRGRHRLWLQLFAYRRLQTAAALAKAAGVTIEAYKCLDTDPNASTFTSAFKKFGKIDVVASDAGINWTKGELIGPPDHKAWKQVMDVNLNGSYHFAKEAGKIFKTQGSGLLIFIRRFPPLSSTSRKNRPHATLPRQPSLE
ncbi:hypothetical protein POJ06DRAFT_303510 [Lipomyces tetrasporus]|uniref:Uncharacterized protein n=1 Tax=Lipomyces tetrasporus TaxID=54092 RepID=A0AAD7VQY5_9ASCO|nr:uncharacterized protein POJ06DRAFT_303510 [Lipomyces tetrasporus]KAJ8098064.1 hypothetical protein POJ06DRAFT_303510 [Lipomyces tetrasporus]